MNIYIRYFDDEALCHNMAEVHQFLSSLSDIDATPKMLTDISEYLESDIVFPKRYKVASRSYFIMIKTQHDTLAEFHAHGKEKSESAEHRSERYDDNRPGWYRCTKSFRRVVSRPDGSGKVDYTDASIEVLLRGQSPRQCHDQIVSYLQGRPDVDSRSQFPTIKESNFKFAFLGEVVVK